MFCISWLIVLELSFVFVMLYIPLKFSLCLMAVLLGFGLRLVLAYILIRATTFLILTFHQSSSVFDGRMVLLLQGCLYPA